MPGNYTINNRVNDEDIDAPKYLADHQIHVDNLEPPKVDDYSASIAQMQATADPGELGSENQPSSLAGELERLRFAIKEIKGTAQWYQSAAANLSTALPVGAFIPYAGATAPTGWLLCNGAAVSRTTYAALFAAIGVVWGSGDGSTTFNVPDLRGRTPIGVGQGTGLTNRALGALLGEEAHVLSAAEGPVHAHGVNDPGHLHPFSVGNAVAGGLSEPLNGVQVHTGELVTGAAVTGITIQAAGASSAHNTMQPSAAAHYIIKT